MEDCNEEDEEYLIHRRKKKKKNLIFDFRLQRNFCSWVLNSFIVEENGEGKKLVCRYKLI